MPLVPMKASGLSEENIADKLHAGHIDHFRVPPTLERLATAWAMVMHETRRGKAMWCFNFGNMTCFGSNPSNFWTARTIEYEKRDGVGPKPTSLYYYAHDTAEQGAVFYWARMAKRFPTALALFDTGDTLAVAKELSRLSYYTGPIKHYADRMAEYYPEFMRRFRQRFLSIAPPPLPDEEGGEVIVMPPIEIRGGWPPGGNNDGGGENA